MHTHFTNPAGDIGIEPGIMEMLQRMETGRFRVFNYLREWYEEVRMYHRKDGKIVANNDDLMSATRYAVQSLKFATTGKQFIVKEKLLDLVQVSGIIFQLIQQNDYMHKEII